VPGICIQLLKEICFISHYFYIKNGILCLFIYHMSNNNGLSLSARYCCSLEFSNLSPLVLVFGILAGTACIIKVKVKHAVPTAPAPPGHRWSVRLPFYGHWAHSWINHWVRGARPIRCQINSYTVFGHWYQIILLGEWRHMCEQLAHGCYLRVLRAQVDPGTFRSLVWLVTVTLPSHPICMMHIDKVL